MQRILIAAFVSAICISTASGQREQAVPERRAAPALGAHTEGRYQLFQGSYHVKGFDRVVQEDAVFLIDTQTGKTWVYVEQASKDATVQGWLALGEVNRTAPERPQP